MTIKLTFRNLAIGVGTLLFLIFLLVGIERCNIRRRASEQPAAGLASVSGSEGLFDFVSSAKRPPAEAMNVALQAREPAENEVDRKLIRNAGLSLLVGDLNKAIAEATEQTNALGGFVEKSDVSNPGGDSPTAEMVLRVPAAKLDDFMRQLKSGAAKVLREQVETKDVTKDYVDLDARLRNMKAEEARYLEILKQAKSVQDTLDVTEKLSDVRGRIEEAQGEMNLLSRQIEMATMNLELSTSAPARVWGINWQPGANAKSSAHDLLAGLASWIDAIVSFVIQLPVYLLWLVTLVFGAWVAAAIVVWVWRRLGKWVSRAWRRSEAA